ncbi:low molecular weight phosphatase family protein [Zavarzinia sp. CC-PAN008]|uniref:arsenate-mycothiol transferase ArsC n=1 Tax=Zavarzinia sp. CC-PAN008 TaxID=3243332 RepID=UPI003F7426D3
MADPHQAGPSLAMPGAVLFCCTNNTIRSPMACGLLKHFYGHRIWVDSVGVRAGEVDGFAIGAMDELGIDLHKHKPKSFDELEDTSYDLIISLSPEAHHKALELTRTMACDVEYWPTLDPSVVEGSRDTRLDAYRDVRDALMRRIKQRFGQGPAPSV